MPSDNNREKTNKTLKEVVKESDKERAETVVKKDKPRLAGMQVLAIIIIIIALIMFALPFVNSALIKRYSQLNLNAFTAADLARNQANENFVPFDDIEEIGIVNVWPWLNKYDRNNIVGLLSFPSLDIELAIFNAATNENLLAGVATLKPELKMGEGNYVISGHRARGKGVLLHNLMDAEIGSIVKITDKKKIYSYRVVDALQVENEAVHMLSDEQIEKYGGKPLLSIMTCHFGKSSSRWFVIASLEDVTDYNDSDFRAED
ncbi:MAG: class A sortase [Eubacteriales bacterium]|nr:class A sortase [Eubacteriales bacterium]